MRKLKNLKHIFFIIILSLTVLFSLVMIFSRDFTNSINGFFIYRSGTGIWQDTIYEHTLRASDDIVIINIDERTLNELQANGDLKMLTIPKKIYSDLVEKLESARAKGIGFDIIFQNSDPDQNEFARTMKKYKNIVIGASYQSAGEDTKKACSYSESSWLTTCKWFPQVTYAGIPWGLVDVGEIGTGSVINENNGAFSRITKFDIFTKSSKQWAETEAGSWKHSLGKNTELYSLAVEMLRLQDSKIIMNKIFRNPTILNPYFGWPRSYKEIPMIDVIKMENLEDLKKIFEWKYVLIGEAGTMIHDSITSPVSGTLMNGVELHAHFLDWLLQDKMLTKIDDATLWIVIIVLTIITVLCYFFLPNYLSPIFAIAVLTLSIWVARYLYDIHRLVIDIFPILLSVFVATFTLTYIYRFFVVDREKHYIENAFGHYIDPKMVEMIDTEEVSVSLWGEERELSVFFSDIAGFTSISEKLSVENLFSLMSYYLSKMTSILKWEWGTLDKYIGDAVMGFFGAPITQADHAVRACNTAIKMRKMLPEINQEVIKRWLEPIDFRVGIASGKVMVGNIGSTDHFNYTVLGDVVNLASRLEATGKEYNVHIIISEWTRLHIGERFELRELDTIAVKWKTEWIRIYELLGVLGEVWDRDIYKKYEEALDLYRRGQYIDAGQLWESQMDQDPPSRVMALRCVDILKWNIQVENGIYHMTHK